MIKSLCHASFYPGHFPLEDNGKDWVGNPGYRHWGFAVVFRDSGFSILLRVARDNFNNNYHSVSIYYVAAALYFL